MSKLNIETSVISHNFQFWGSRCLLRQRFQSMVPCCVWRWCKKTANLSCRGSETPSLGAPKSSLCVPRPLGVLLVGSGDPASWMGTKQQNHPFFHAETCGCRSRLSPQPLSHRDTPRWLKMQQLQDLLGGFNAKEHKLWILRPARRIFFFKASFLGAVGTVSCEEGGFHPSSAVRLWVEDKWAQLGWVSCAGAGWEMRDYTGKKAMDLSSTGHSTGTSGLLKADRWERRCCRV